jgi:gliding motility-associated-like protein
VDIEVTNQGQDDWYLQAATYPICNFHQWDMGDGTRYRTPDVVHSYLDLEEHWVTLEVRTIHGCTGIDSVLLRPPAHIYFPNAFTPDGDGVNDTWGAVGHYIEEFRVELFNRWGELIFTSTDMDIPWDGKANGSGDAQTGVYVYKYRAAGHLFPAIEGFGHVTLLRGSQE